MSYSGPGQRLHEWRTSWGVVLAATIGMAIGNMHVHFMGAMIKPLQEAYGWSRGEISLGLTLITAVNLLAYLSAGTLVDRLGFRRVALWGIWVFGLAFSAVGLAGPQLWTWYVACILLAFLGQGVSPVVWTAGVVRHFFYQRGLALALSLAGTGVIAAVMPTVVVLLADDLGVKGVFPVIGTGGALLMFVPVVLYFREPTPTVVTSRAQQQPDSARPLPGHTVKEAFLSRRFWQLTLALTITAFCIGTFLMHIQPMLIDSGLTPLKAASVAFFVGPSLIVGRLLIGLLFDYLDLRLVAGFALLLPFISSVLLLSLDGGYGIAVAAGIFIGLSVGAEVDVVAYLLSRYFGLRRYGVLFAILVSIYGLGIGSGSAVAGVVYDVFDTYGPLLLGLAAASLAATGLITSMGSPPQEVSQEAGNSDNKEPGRPGR